MAKHSHVEDHAQRTHGRVTHSTIAYYFRNNPTLDSALAEVGAQRVKDDRLKRELRSEVTRLRKAIRKERSFESAWPVFEKWLKEVKREEGVETLSRWTGNPRVVLAAELEWLVPRLAAVYLTPREFFCSILLADRSSGFASGPELMDAVDEWNPRNPLTARSEIQGLAVLFRTWGVGAMLNPGVQRDVARLDETSVSRFLALAEGRPAFRDGRPRGRSDGPDSTRPKTDHAKREAEVLERQKRYVEEYGFPPKTAKGRAIKAQGKKDKRRPNTIKKSLQKVKKVR